MATSETIEVTILTLDTEEAEYLKELLNYPQHDEDGDIETDEEQTIREAIWDVL